MSTTRIIIRPLRLNDAANINELMNMPNVLWGTLSYPSTGIDQWKRKVEEWIADEHTHIFVADIKEQVAGAVIVRISPGRQRHLARVSIVVHDRYQGQGIGKMLMLTAIDLADNWLNLLRLEAEIFIDNERALRLYQSFDFQIEGRKRLAVFRGGSYIDCFSLARIRSGEQPHYAGQLAETASSDGQTQDAAEIS